ncbi:MAG: nuclear transport factor 2 family protein [Alphaproteobacteria bacterium]|nr:nuclear transport factor 2 family protein [Alphaproteobacteria bacterium]
MTADHPNVRLLKQLDLGNLGAMTDLFAPDFVWHYFNPKLPDLEGDYAGLDGLQRFFRNLGGKSAGTFKVEPISVTAYGDELVVAHVRDTMAIDGQSIVLDALAVWRMVDGRIAEGWDIPAINAASALTEVDSGET